MVPTRTRDTTMHRDPFTSTTRFQPALARIDGRTWPSDLLEPAGDGPGLLVSQMFWLGGGVSLLLWGFATGLVLYFR